MSHTFLKKRAFARIAIELSSQKVYRRKEFFLLLTSGRYTPKEYRMTNSEADDYFSVLSRSGIIVVHDDFVYGNTKDVIDAVHLKCGLPLVSSSTPDLLKKRAMCSAVLSNARQAVKPAITRAVQKEKDFWAFVATCSGMQMLVLAYLTFQVFGWDVMEPASYFLTTATALCSYGYLLCFRREHSYTSVDDYLLPWHMENELSTSFTNGEEVLSNATMLKELGIIIPEQEDAAELVKRGICAS